MPVGSLTLTNGGSGYAAAPTCQHLWAAAATGATASLTFTGAYVNNLTLTSGGPGYTLLPRSSSRRLRVSTPGTAAAATAFFTAWHWQRHANEPRVTGYTHRATVTLRRRWNRRGGYRYDEGECHPDTRQWMGSGYRLPRRSRSQLPRRGGTAGYGTAVVSRWQQLLRSMSPTDGSGYICRPTVTIAPPPAGGGNCDCHGISPLAVDAVTVTNLAAQVIHLLRRLPSRRPLGGGVRATGTANRSGAVTSSCSPMAAQATPLRLRLASAGTPTTLRNATATILPGRVTEPHLDQPGHGLYLCPERQSSRGAATYHATAAALATPTYTAACPRRSRSSSPWTMGG